MSAAPVLKIPSVAVIPAQAGIQINMLDAGFHRHDDTLPLIELLQVSLHGLAGVQKRKKPRMRLERDTLALAAFVSRPQAEAQIGANRIEIYNVIRSLSMQNVLG